MPVAGPVNLASGDCSASRVVSLRRPRQRRPSACFLFPPLMWPLLLIGSESVLSQVLALRSSCVPLLSLLIRRILGSLVRIIVPLLLWVILCSLRLFRSLLCVFSSLLPPVPHSLHRLYEFSCSVLDWCAMGLPPFARLAPGLCLYRSLLGSCSLPRSAFSSLRVGSLYRVRRMAFRNIRPGRWLDTSAPLR